MPNYIIRDFGLDVRDIKLLMMVLRGIDPRTAGPVTARDIARELHGAAGESQIDHEEFGCDLGFPADDDVELPHRIHDLAEKVGSLSAFQAQSVLFYVAGYIEGARDAA